MILMEFDKAGAEWVCVAYLSGDARMMLSLIKVRVPIDCGSRPCSLHRKTSMPPPIFAGNSFETMSEPCVVLIAKIAQRLNHASTNK